MNMNMEMSKIIEIKSDLEKFDDEVKRITFELFEYQTKLIDSKPLNLKSKEMDSDNKNELLFMARQSINRIKQMAKRLDEKSREKFELPHFDFLPDDILEKIYDEKEQISNLDEAA